MSKPVLYSYWRSSCGWRVRIALNLKGIDYETHPINIGLGNHYTEEYQKINPLNQVPALKIDGTCLTQSMAILEYLEETRPEISLMPKDPIKKAKMREICELITSGIQPLQNNSVIDRYSQDDDKKAEWVRYWINKGFEALEIILSASAGKYCVGNSVTLADACLVPQVFNANRFKVDMSQYPIISKINIELENNSAFKASHATAQVDYLGEYVQGVKPPDKADK